MFSGQGSQYYQMGRELFERHPVFRKWMFSLDSIVRESIGNSVLDRAYDEKRQRTEPFVRTLHTHPAIFMVEYSLAQVLLENGIKPDAVVGASLGEFVSAVLAEVMEVEDALEAVVKQAEIFEATCEKGGMISILHDPRLYREAPALYENSELAGVNYGSHFIVSGDDRGIKNVEAFLKEKNIVYQVLPVSFGFHSSRIEPAAEAYKNYLKTKSFRRPQVPMLSCFSGAAVQSVSQCYFWDIVRYPMEFPKAIRAFERDNKNNIFFDLGPGGTLANFAKRNIADGSKSESFAIITPFNQNLKNLEQIKKISAGKFLPKKKVEKMTTFVFPGQGSQQKGMGETLFDEFKDLTEIADAVLGYSIKTLCLEDPDRQLGKTQYTQPALFTVNALSYLKRIKERERIPDYVAGHSLGEYNALFAAGAFDFETGLKLVKKRGKLMSTAAGGGMAAVIGLDEKKIDQILRDNNLTTIGIANYNSPSQIVISGPRADIVGAGACFEKTGAKYIPLNVSGAFHSRHMQSAKEAFEEFLKTFKFREPTIPVISNTQARPYKHDEVKRTLAEQIINPVKWTESIRYLMGLGEMTFEEIGPGMVLTKLIQNIQKESEPLVFEDDGRDTTARQSKAMPEGAAPSVFTHCTKSSVSDANGNGRRPSAVLTGITAPSLGSGEFKKTYNLTYAYVAGGMYRGIASSEMVVRMGKAGMMGFFGTGGLESREIETAIHAIRKELDRGEPYGMNLLHNPLDPRKEQETVDLYLRSGVSTVEAAAYMGITPSLVHYRLKGVKRNSHGKVFAAHRVIAKVSRPEVAEAFLSPAPDALVKKLFLENKVTREEAELSKEIPMADDLCVEADSGGHTDGGVAYALMPAMAKLRDEMMRKYGYTTTVRVGAAGGIGTPEAAAAAFILGADFILTGSINQCTVEAGTSTAAKDLLQQINIQDTDYAPAGDMFELGAKVQVLKKGVFFPARANKLYDLYRFCNSLDEIDDKTKKQLQERYFKRTFEEIYEEAKKYCPSTEIERAERNPKQKMALVFRWYFGHATRLALTGAPGCEIDYQIHCGPALGAFNQWVRGTPLENWRNRRVNEIAIKIMNGAAELLNQRFQKIVS